MQRFAKAVAAFEAATLSKTQPNHAELQRLSDEALFDCLINRDEP